MITVTDSRNSPTMMDLILMANRIARRADLSVRKVLDEAIAITGTPANNIFADLINTAPVNFDRRDFMVPPSNFNYNPADVQPVSDQQISHDHTTKDDSGSEQNKSYREPIAYRYDLIPEVMLQRLAAIYEEGVKKYGEQAYIKKPLPFSVIVNHIKNHHSLYIRGNNIEDHLAKIIWGYTAMLVLEELHNEGNGENQNDLGPYGVTVE